MSKAKSRSELKFPTQSKDLPATQGMLQLVRSELKSEMKAGFRNVDSKIEQVHSDVARVGSDVAQVRSEVAQVRSDVARLSSEVAQVTSEIARVGLLVEEQNSRNRIVMEGLTGLFQRQDRVELKVDEVESMVQSIAARARR